MSVCPPGHTSAGSMELVTTMATAQSLSAFMVKKTTSTGLTGSRYNT